MSFVSPTAGQVLLLPLALLVFLVPGWLMARRWPTPIPWVTAFLGSAALLFLLVLALNALHVPLRAGTLGPGFAAASVGLLWRWPVGVSVLGAHRRWARPRKADWWWVPPTALAALSLGARLLVDPQSGFDNTFRWDYLARLFLTHQSLAGYPPVTAADFEYYSWCDGIPPLIPILNAWIYGGTGSIAPVLTGARVAAEAAMLGAVIFRFSQLWWGARAGWVALAVFSSSALALWGVAIAQETALLALALLVMLYLLEEHARAPRTALWCWASIAAGVGAATREYGLAFPAFGLLVLLARGDTRTALRFAWPAALIAGPWYLRNWVITGNPLYPHTLGGLFPGNAVHEEIQRYIGEYWNLGTSAFPPTLLAAMVGAMAGLPVLLGAVGLVRARPVPVAALAGIAMIAGLWFWSIGYTAGGWMYSTRVLLPAVALLAVFAGWLQAAAARVRIALALLVILTAADAARRSWMLPLFPFTNAASFSMANWRTMHEFAASPVPYRLWTELQRQAGEGGIVVDHPAHHSLLTLCRGRAVPLVSPVLASTYDERLPFEVVLAQLRQAGIRFVTLTPANPITTDLVRAHRFWRDLRRREPNGSGGLVVIYDLDRLNSPATPSPRLRPQPGALASRPRPAADGERAPAAPDRRNLP